MFLVTPAETDIETPIETPVDTRESPVESLSLGCSGPALSLSLNMTDTTVNQHLQSLSLPLHWLSLPWLSLTVTIYVTDCHYPDCHWLSLSLSLTVTISVTNCHCPDCYCPDCDCPVTHPRLSPVEGWLRGAGGSCRQVLSYVMSTALHCSALLCTALHCPALLCTALHSTALHTCSDQFWRRHY